MKKLTLVLVAILFAVTGILAQTPNEFKYQAVLRDASGAIMASEAVTVDISILQGSASGTSVFTEQHSVTTTAQGLINLNIGSVEDLSVVDFSSDIYFIEITVNDILMGASQLLSVPYALQAKKVENVDYSQITNTPILFDGDYNSLSNLPTLFDGSYNSLTDLPTLFSGNYNDLTNQPTLFDGAYGSLTGTPTTISGYGITDAFSGNYNDLTNQPTLFDGAYSSLTGTPTTISGYGITDAFSGSYTDLTNKPTNATTSVDGFMSSADKTKLDGLTNADGSETSVTAGTNVNVTGTGTSGDPYVVSGIATHYVGELMGTNGEDGVVFYVDETGLHGLICSIVDIDGGSGVVWSNIVNVEIGATAKSEFNGSTNTIAIIGQPGHTNSAAKLCAEYSTTGTSAGDWYLPSIDELSQIYNSKYQINKALNTNSFALNNYFSSTEYDNNEAWKYYFDGSYSESDSKAATGRVRAVRAF